MKILGPTRFERLNEAAGLVFLAAGLFFTLALVSYNPQDPSWNSIAGSAHARNLTGLAGSYTADLCLQLLGFGAFAIPVLLWMLAWKWIRSEEIDGAGIKIFGAGLLFLSISTALSIGPVWRPGSGSFSAGGMLGLVLAAALRSSLNVTGTALLTFVCLILSLYLISTFSMSIVARWFVVPMNYVVSARVRWDEWREKRQQEAAERARRRAERRAAAEEEARRMEAEQADIALDEVRRAQIPIAEPVDYVERVQRRNGAPPAEAEEIPIHELEHEAPTQLSDPFPAVIEEAPPEPRRTREPRRLAPEMAQHPDYQLPSTELLNEVPGRSPYDSAGAQGTRGPHQV